MSWVAYRAESHGEDLIVFVRSFHGRRTPDWTAERIGAIRHRVAEEVQWMDATPVTPGTARPLTVDETIREAGLCQTVAATGVDELAKLYASVKDPDAEPMVRLALQRARKAQGDGCLAFVAIDFPDLGCGRNCIEEIFVTVD